MWEQGDRFRRANPNHPSAQHLANRSNYPIYSIIQNQILQENKQNNVNKPAATVNNSSGSSDSFTKIVSKVERIKIEDESNGNNPSGSGQVQGPPVGLLNTDFNDEDASNGNLQQRTPTPPKEEAPFSGRSVSTPPKTPTERGEGGNGAKTPMTQGDRLNAIKASRTQPHSPTHSVKSRIGVGSRVKSVPHGHASSVFRTPGPALGASPNLRQSSRTTAAAATSASSSAIGSNHSPTHHGNRTNIVTRSSARKTSAIR